MYTIEHLEGPNGETFVTEDPVGVEITDVHRQLTPFPGPFLSPNRSASAGTGVGTLLAPNTPSVELNPGIWRFSVGALRSLNRVDTSVDVTALIKRGSDVQSAGVVSVNLFFTGARDWNAANTPNDPSFQQALTRMAAFYEAVGIRLGEVTYNDIPERYRVVDTGSDDLTASGSSLHEMFRLNQYESGVSFFFVDRIGTGQNGGFIAGLSGGTPGPVTQPNNVRNGIAVATLMFPDPDAIGHVMGHEMGHFLGLFHTQEFIPSITDQIEDTPVGEAGADNLMFPTVTNMPAYLSDGQAWVLHRNILVRRRDEAQP